jgi:transposase-like protein
MVDLIEQCQVACNELIDVTGRAAIQAVLQLSAIEAAGGSPQQGKRRVADVVFYGRQPGQVFLSDRKLEVERPRLRRKRSKSHEVEVPAYAAMRDQEQMGARMLDTLLHGVSTRNYRAVIPEMAETAGVSRSAVSRAAIEASEAEVEALLNRRFDELKLLVIYIDGLIFGDYTMIGAVDVDVEGKQACAGHPRRRHRELHGHYGASGRHRGEGR